MKEFITNIMENVAFVIGFLVVAAIIIIIAYLFEKLFQKRDGIKGKILTTQKVVMIGMLAALAGGLMLFEFPLPLIAPPFYKVDMSEVPVLICGLAFGPVASVMTELVKIMVKLMLKGTSTAFVGEFANFCVGCSMVLPVTIIFHAFKKKSSLLKSSIILVAANVVGVISMTVFGSFFNAVYLLPAFAALYGMPLESIIQMGTALNPMVTDQYTFAAICVAPLNLIKGLCIMFQSTIIYIPLRIIINHVNVQKNTSRISGSY